MRKFTVDVYVQLDTDTIRKCLFEIRPHAQTPYSDSVHTGVCFQKGKTGNYGNATDTGISFYLQLNHNPP
jgi:hypothetical protein